MINYKNSYSQLLVIFISLFFIFSSNPVVSAQYQADYSSDAWWRQWVEDRRSEEKQIDMELESLGKRESQAAAALKQSQDSLRIAKEQKSRSAIKISKQAIEIAQKTLSRIKDEKENYIKPKALKIVAAATFDIEGDYDGAIGYLKRVAKLEPDNDEIKKAIGYILYKRDQTNNQLETNPRTEYVLDALEQGNGDWQRSMNYLKDALSKEKNEEKAQAIRDALIYTEGLSAAENHKAGDDPDEWLNSIFDDDLAVTLKRWKEQSEKRMLKSFETGLKNFKEGKLDEAIDDFKSVLVYTRRDDPARINVYEMINYTEGMRDAQKKKAREASQGWIDTVLKTLGLEE